MEPLLQGGLALAALVLLLALGVPLAFATALVGFVALLLLLGPVPALSSITTIPFVTSSEYAFTVIPLFIMMGYMAGASGAVEDLFRAARAWVGRLPGGLAMASVLGAAAFSAASGSSLASSAVLGKTCIPEMLRYGYDKRLAFGTIAASATLDPLIPPSVLLVLYAVMVEQPVGKLLIAGIFPGLLLAGSYMLLVYVIARRNPRLAPPGPGVAWRARLLSLQDTWGISLIVLIVLGGLYLGVCTPTEAGGIGAAGAFLLAVARRRLTWPGLGKALLETGAATAMIFAIVIGVVILSRFLALSQFSRELAALITGVSANPYLILGGVVVLYLFLGMFLDALGLMLLTLPVVYPLMVGLGFDPVWFGIVVVELIGIGLITPPVGMNCYVLKGVFPEVPLETIFGGVLWFVVVALVNILLLILFPDIALFLPAQM